MSIEILRLLVHFYLFFFFFCNVCILQYTLFAKVFFFVFFLGDFFGIRWTKHKRLSHLIHRLVLRFKTLSDLIRR